MRKRIAALWIWLALLAGAALAEEPLSIAVPAGEIRPGRPAIVTLMVPEDGTCDVTLRDEAGSRSYPVAEGRPVTAGYNSLYWNGTSGGVAVPAVDWVLAVRMNGETAETPVRIGRMIPCLISVRTETDTVQEGDTVLLAFYATEEGSLTLHVDDETEPLYWENIAAGEGEAGFQAEIAPGSRTFSFIAGSAAALGDDADALSDLFRILEGNEDLRAPLVLEAAKKAAGKEGGADALWDIYAESFGRNLSGCRLTRPGH